MFKERGGGVRTERIRWKQQNCGQDCVKGQKNHSNNECIASYVLYSFCEIVCNRDLLNSFTISRVHPLVSTRLFNPVSINFEQVINFWWCSDRTYIYWELDQ